MSEIAVLQFIQHISTDVAFTAEVVKSAGSDVTKIVRFAAAHGYYFTTEEFQSIFGGASAAPSAPTAPAPETASTLSEPVGADDCTDSPIIGYRQAPASRA